ncbi:MAG: hypothetical protein K0U86_21440 [Planctomycetes bacterium]|nr:hypothetical protein [Planctomycetota bacterium]MCH9727470.1 hypothetical protein [Planctomycetota bacterium]MCH9775975.1 hypothetical protein [Planctomycetota bacterium]
MRFSRPVTAALFTYTATLIVLILALFFLVQETSAQKRTSKLNASPANPVEAAALEFALSAEELNALIGKKADLLTTNGKEEQGVEITRFYTGRDKSQIKTMEFKGENASRPKKLFATKLFEMKVDEKTYRFLYLPSRKAAVLEDTGKRMDAIRDKLTTSNHLLWKDTTEEDQESYVNEHKEFLQKVGQHFSSFKMSFYETKYFLFYTDMPAPQVKPYLVQLDKMNELLGKAFGFKPGHNIWRGKAVIVAFMTEAAFLEFERKFYNRTEVPGTVVGLCHSHGDGKVIVSCHRGNNPNFFGAVLVHETAHGYIHRYRSTVHIPSWINEGIADWVAMMVVPSCKEIQRRQTQSALQLRQSQTFGGQFFSADQIGSAQYGAASAMIQLMLKAGPEQFKLFFNGIKDGLTWQDSLQRAYGLTAEQLCQAYGKSIGIPLLTP